MEQGTQPLSRKLSLIDTLRFLLLVVIPTWTIGIIVRRPFWLFLAERFDWTGRGCRLLETFLDRYGAAPVELRAPGRRRHFLLLSPGDAAIVLDKTPDPFSPATDEKISALRHFEPCVALISRGPERTVRRALSDHALQSDCPVHVGHSVFEAIIRREAAALFQGRRHIDWYRFRHAWYRSVRGIVLGEGAAADDGLIDQLDRLRANANWAFFRKIARADRDAFHRRVAAYLHRKAPGGLLVLADDPDMTSAPTHQISQWLFAFDAGAIATWNALALLSARQGAVPAKETAREDFLRGAFVEAVRLWPTTPAILRQAETDTSISGVGIPAEANLMLFTPFFHRSKVFSDDPECFRPERWSGKDSGNAMPFFPFSAGSGKCPGRHLVALVASKWLRVLLANPLQRSAGGFDPAKPLPGTISHFRIKFAVAR